MLHVRPSYIVPYIEPDISQRDGTEHIPFLSICNNLSRNFNFRKVARKLGKCSCEGTLH
jgi:hypothetical protein